ncbi:TetR/AcrR family transcriptional regulator [Phytomonospora sp. NPDC050363]|uniref:TetR/AcrR family transcriptional regulator n=1 Tax=Phytomonospora sp. NPDC050363 TaxID=3155642 RepID=UPI0033CC8FE0
MTISADAGAARAPGRPRDPGVAEAIFEAVFSLLAEGASIEALSIEAIASKAGVGKATIYRRWPGKDELIMDAISAMKSKIPEPKGESVREDLLAIMQSTAVSRDVDRDARVIPCIALEMRRNPKFARLHAEVIEARREVSRAVLRRGIATGELRPDIDIEVTLLMLTSPMLTNKLFGPYAGIETTELSEKVLDTVLTGVAGPNL